MAARHKKKRTVKKKRRTRRPARRRTQARASYGRLVADAGVFCLTLLVGAAALFAYIARDLPDTNALWHDAGAPKRTLLAADGAPITVHGASAGAPIRLSELPSHVPLAVLAVEDRNFYHHFGVNPISVLRAIVVNARSGEVVQGGSTITQQLAKNIFLNPDRTLKRKAQELILAVWLEQKFTKDEILTLYLNRVYFGGGAYGIDAAAYRYFGKSAHELSTGEAAILAGLLKAPSRLAPTSNPLDAGRRGRLVIDQMVSAKFLTVEEAGEILSKPIMVASTQFSAAPYFVDYALSEARKLAGDVDADLIIHTTFDRRLQNAVELGVISGRAQSSDNARAAQSAAVIIDGAGAVKAMVGGVDYGESQFNRAVQAKRQPGSVFKPFVYLAALERGYQQGDIVLDAPVSVGKWSPDNYKSKYYGEVSLREALSRSLNSATVARAGAGGTEQCSRCRPGHGLAR